MRDGTTSRSTAPSPPPSWSGPWVRSCLAAAGTGWAAGASWPRWSSSCPWPRPHRPAALLRGDRRALPGPAGRAPVAAGAVGRREFGGATTFVTEHAPAGRRGWYGSWQWATLALGLATGIGVAALLAGALPQAAFVQWGWRLAFLAAVPLGLVGLYLRLRLDETPRFRAVRQAGAVARRPVRQTLRAYPGRVLLGFGLVAAVTLTFNTFFLWLPNHLVATLAVPLPRALASTLLGLALAAGVAPLFGRLSDLVGRKLLLIAGTLALLVLTLPAYLLARWAGPVGLRSPTSWSDWP